MGLTIRGVTKASEWAQRVAAWRASGETSKQFCKKRGYSASSLLWWSSELNRRGRLPSRDNPLALTRVIRKPGPERVRLCTSVHVHGDGVHVELSAGADIATLESVINVVAARARSGGRR